MGMAVSDLAKKLRLQSGQKALAIHPPEGFAEELGGLPEGVEWSEVQEGGSIPADVEAWDFIILFAGNAAAVRELAPAALQAVKKDGLLWMCYPKGSSKVQTDLNRDTGWGPVSDAGWEGVSLVSVNGTWSAMRFRPLEATSRGQTRTERMAERKAKGPGEAASGDKTVEVPDDVTAALAGEPEVEAFFAKLAYSHRKEYIRWITEAKREETRKDRIAKMIVKLTEGKKRPSDK